MMDKMIMAVVPQNQTEAVLRALVAAGYTATFGASRGGKLRQAQQTLFVAVAECDLKEILNVIRDNCRTRIPVEPSQSTNRTLSNPMPTASAKLGGAVVFVWDIERSEIY